MHESLPVSTIFDSLCSAHVLRSNDRDTTDVRCHLHDPQLLQIRALVVRTAIRVGFGLDLIDEAPEILSPTCTPRWWRWARKVRVSWPLRAANEAI